jgi:hypothetical protein
MLPTFVVAVGIDRVPQQHRPMAPPLLLFAGQASSGSVPMIAGLPPIGNAPWVSNPLRAALSGSAAAKLALAPWIFITLTSVAMLLGASIALPHLLKTEGSYKVNTSDNPRQQTIPLTMPGQTECLPVGLVHVHDAQIPFCTSRSSTASGDSQPPQQQEVVLSKRSSSPASTVLLPYTATGNKSTVVPSQVTRLLRLNATAPVTYREYAQQKCFQLASGQAEHCQYYIATAQGRSAKGCAEHC